MPHTTYEYYINNTFPLQQGAHTVMSSILQNRNLKQKKMKELTQGQIASCRWQRQDSSQRQPGPQMLCAWPTHCVCGRLCAPPHTHPLCVCDCSSLIMKILRLIHKPVRDTYTTVPWLLWQWLCSYHDQAFRTKITGCTLNSDMPINHSTYFNSFCIHYSKPQ